MTTPAIITVAITGAIPRKADTPAVPVTPSEQVESTHEAFEAGASVAHIHVRNKDETPSSDPALFAQVQEGIAKHCPGMIIQFSTGGRGREQNERGKMLSLMPHMASLATGSVNFPKQIYENPPQLVEDLARAMLQYEVKPEIEVFDVAMLYNAKAMADRGLLKSVPSAVRHGHCQCPAGAAQIAGIFDRRAQGDHAGRHVVGGGHCAPPA